MPSATECVPVPSSEHVAEIVGRQGCKIKALRAKTNTYIKTPVRGEDAVFIVTGRKEDVESAKQEILSAAEHFTQIRASRRHSQGGIPAPGHITAYVRVPYKFVGLVVGPKGATIKRIQQQTHTYIITPSRDKEPIFEVTGLSENVEQARYEIEMHIGSRTGHILMSAADSSQALNDFHLNGTETPCAMEAMVGNGDGDSSASIASTIAALHSAAVATMPAGINGIICKPAAAVQMMQQQQNRVAASTITAMHHAHAHNNHHLHVHQQQHHRNNMVISPLGQEINNGMAHLSLCDSSNNSYNSVGSLVNNSQVNFGYNSWTNGVNGSNTAISSTTKGLSTMNSSGSDQDEGVWSTGGESPNSLSVEPLVPPCLSSIWSDLEDPKDVGVLQKRSASISVVDSCENQHAGTWFRSNQALPTSWPSSMNNLPNATAALSAHQQRLIGGGNGQPAVVVTGNGGGGMMTSSNGECFGANGGHPNATTANTGIAPAGSLYRRATAPVVRCYQTLTQQAHTNSIQQQLQQSNSEDSASNVAIGPCFVCQAAPAAQAQLTPCNHRCFCFVCATRLRQMPKPICPACQTPITGAIRLA